MSKDRSKWRLASLVGYSADVRDCESESDVLQLTRGRAETGREQRPQGDEASSMLAMCLPGPSLQPGQRPGLRQLKEAHNEQKGTVLSSDDPLTGLAGAVHFTNQLQSALLTSQSQQDLKS